MDIRSETEVLLREQFCQRTAVGGHGGMPAFGPGKTPDSPGLCWRCNLPAFEAEMSRVSAIYFRGGPLDGTAYATGDLMKNSNPTLTRQLGAYKFTDEILTSEASGVTARVWIPKDAQPIERSNESASTKERSARMSETAQEAPVPGGFEDVMPTAPDPVPANGPVIPEVPVPVFGTNPDAAESPVAENAENVDASPPVVEGDVQAQAPAQASDSPAVADASAAPSEPAVPHIDGLPTADFHGETKQLEAVRKEHKISRSTILAKIAEHRGDGEFGNAVMWRALYGGGPRTPTNSEEVATVHKALLELVKEKFEKVESKRKAKKADDSAVDLAPEAAPVADAPADGGEITGTPSPLG